MKVILQLLNLQTKSTSEVTLLLGQSIILGRSSHADYVIDDSKMSGKHSRILLKEDRLEIFDMDSKNGTYLNGIRIDQSEIFIGDEVKLGDTTIAIHSPKLDAEVVNILTFPGPFKDRLEYELKADFTGVREKNQHYSKLHPREKGTAFSKQEIDLRKKARTRIRLSKNEIKAKTPMLSSLSFVIDLCLLFFMILLPVYFMNRVIKHGFLSVSGSHFSSSKFFYIAIMELIVIVIYLSSQKIMKYTIGEKISGIEDLHQKQ